MATRKIPRPFSLHWGSGLISEEASFDGEHHVPSFQLLEFTDGEAKGSTAIRFCFYDHRGRFQLDPLIISDGELGEMRAALAGAPRLREVLRKLVAD